MATPDPTPDQVRWLDEDEQRVWRQVLFGLRRLEVRLDADLKAAGLSHDDFGVLVHLSESPEDRLRMSDLALGTVESRSRLSHHIARMEKKGWVRREACPQDRRGSWAVLTPEGRATIEAVAPVHVDGVRRWFFDLVAPDQLRVLGEVFGRVDDRLRDDLGSTCTEGDDSRSD